MVYNGKPYEQMDDLVFFPLFLVGTPKFQHQRNQGKLFAKLSTSVLPLRSWKKTAMMAKLSRCGRFSLIFFVGVFSFLLWKI